ncbi:hypothetical protein GCM10010842_13130 [Deinococcus daejeonensis]|uniref:Uncharacterized protein n=1 Tax=Deinococcus daejeonensis TaxID=1007098 RepID=A0ABQ2J1U1_9DEIO|nr:hypothetical protein GCM10010842_13130 [Deinococcus daejeonensis]
MPQDVQSVARLVLKGGEQGEVERAGFEWVHVGPPTRVLFCKVVVTHYLVKQECGRQEAGPHFGSLCHRPRRRGALD